MGACDVQGSVQAKDAVTVYGWRHHDIQVRKARLGTSFWLNGMAVIQHFVGQDDKTMCNIRWPWFCVAYLNRSINMGVGIMHVTKNDARNVFWQLTEWCKK